MNSITVTAEKWEQGWELSIDGEVVTQVTTLDKAEQQIRDYLDTVAPNVDHSDVSVLIKPLIGSLADQVLAARSATEKAQRAQEDAAKESRLVARQLRASGFSIADAAAILGISRGRVSQLVNH